jgi:hypothetical protein
LIVGANKSENSRAVAMRPPRYQRNVWLMWWWSWSSGPAGISDVTPSSFHRLEWMWKLEPASS